MAWYDFLIGTPSRSEQVQRFTPQQKSALNQILGQATQGLQPQNFGAGFEPIAQQARKQFHEQTVPTIAERFASMGSNAPSSPSFISQLGQAGAGLDQALAAQKAQFGLQQQGLLQNLLGMGLTPQFENLYHPAQPGLFQQGISPAIQALMSYLIPGASSLSAFGGSGQSQTQSTGLGGTPIYSSGFGQKPMWGPGMQSLINPY